MAGHRMGSDSTRLNHRYLRYCPAQASTSRGSASLQPSSWDPAGGRGSRLELQTEVHPKVCNHGEGPY